MAQQLILLRHGTAVPHESKPDFERELTERGQDQARLAGLAMARLGVEPAACYTSPRVRAYETAEAACGALTIEPEARAVIGAGFSAAAALDLLAEHGDGEQVLVVGHNPSFEQVVLDLTGARVGFKKGGIAAIEVRRGRGDLLAMLPPRHLAAIAGESYEETGSR